ncbi:MAG: hypothetical protein Q9166_007041 [cf. Caloplaca sp. 2 TL-2023]
MKPEVQEVSSLLHLTYNPPGRVHAVQPYPLPAPNGSTVLFLGHEHGLQILWRGGRALKDQSKKSQHDGDRNPGQSISSNSDNEPDTSVSYHQDAYLESDEGEYDPSTPFEPIVQALDLPFGLAALRIVFPHLPTDSLQRDHGIVPPLFSEKLVAAVICSDASVRLVVLPASPPSTLRKWKAAATGKPCVADGRVGSYGEQVKVITGGNDHQVVPNCVAITLAPSGREDSDVEMGEDDARSRWSASGDRRRQTSRTRNQSKPLQGDEDWDVLVASSSSDLSGLLLIHRIPLLTDGTNLDLTTTDHTVPWSIQHLSSPAAAIRFNPSLPYDERDSILLIAEAKGPVRIFSCLPTKTAAQCTWLVSLFPDFQSSTRGAAARKHVLDAQWVQGGKAILVLLADGEWGIWDLWDAKPKGSAGTQAPQSRTLGSFSKFAFSGSITASPRISSTDDQDLKTRNGGRADILAPTTPGTRRARRENLFSGPVQQTEGPARGGISIVPKQDASANDETVLLWRNDSIAVIPSLRTHWANKVKGAGNLFGSGAKGEARTISNVSLRGERRTDVSLLPAGGQSNYRRSPSHNDVLVLGETRFVLVAAPLDEPQVTSRNPLKPSSDQRLLERGDLTLEGMDRVLASMSDSTATNNLTTNGVPSKRKVNFLDI